MTQGFNFASIPDLFGYFRFIQYSVHTLKKKHIDFKLLSLAQVKVENSDPKLFK